MIRKTHISRQPVASGSYVVSTKKEGTLDAYLGTCVGVALCDRQAGVGGLIHLLLPEPTSTDVFGRPENYATTGLPLFIRDLCDKGAEIDRLEASIAGGALVGPLSEIDLSLDIGGRTVEIVEKILHGSGISVHRSETGGHFSCCLSLDLETWESHIDPISIPATSTKTDFERPALEQLDSVVESVRPIPQIALKIIRMIRDDSHSMQDMAKEIRQDQIISAKVIKLCNSAFFRMKMRIDSIDRALVVLGEKRLLQMVVSAVVEDFFSQDRQGYSLCKGGLFNHALGTAMISERLADLTRKVPADIAYTAGLLHDIGKVVLDQYMAIAYPLFYRRTQVDGDNLIGVEREVFGIAHTEAGGRLAESWSLSEDLVEVIRHHHHPEEAAGNPELTHLVYLADLLMSRFMVGQELERLCTDSLASRLQKLGISIKKFPRIIDSISGQLFDIPLSGAY
ncbi:MAG: HDOD domain-containing protein [Deltaproteobacteria bacterium]|nr:HDOD domain-containing protein [Deltaproteobacteria bacterium]